jgi:hypothetical protein
MAVQINPTQLKVTFPIKSDKTFAPKMIDGETRTFELTKVTLTEGVVGNFSDALPQSIKGKQYSELSKAEQKIVNDTEPKKWSNGEPIEKLSHIVELEFTETITGWQFKKDVKFYLSETFGPKKALYDFVEKLTGGEVSSGEFNLSNALPLGAWFDAVVVEQESKEGKKYMHINPTTLTPHVGEKTVKKAEFSEKEQALVTYLSGEGAGMPVFDLTELTQFGTPAEILDTWNGIKGKVQKFQNDDNTVNIVL